LFGHSLTCEDVIHLFCRNEYPHLWGKSEITSNWLGLNLHMSSEFFYCWNCQHAARVFVLNLQLLYLFLSCSCFLLVLRIYQNFMKFGWILMKSRVRYMGDAAGWTRWAMAHPKFRPRQ